MCAATTANLKIGQDTKDRVQQLADIRRQTPHWLLPEAVEPYIEREKTPESRRQDALAAWSDYRTDGLHLTANEADAWRAKLEGGEDAPLPKCHG